jgi:hypothetical protein
MSNPYDLEAMHRLGRKSIRETELEAEVHELRSRLKSADATRETLRQVVEQWRKEAQKDRDSQHFTTLKIGTAGLWTPGPKPTVPVHRLALSCVLVICGCFIVYRSNRRSGIVGGAVIIFLGFASLFIGLK